MVFAQDRYSELQKLTKVLNIIQKYYVEEIEIKKLIRGGIKGMLRELDPHTNYLSSEVYKNFEKETKGEFGGLGIEITIKDEKLIILSPIEDTPAWKAGLKAGDEIVSIDGIPTKGLNLSETAQKIRGKRGSLIRLGILRDSFKKPKIFKIARNIIRMKSVKYVDLGNGDAYIRLTHFIQNSVEEFKKRIRRHRKKHKKISGLIIDVRKNPGGLFDQAVKIADLFLNEGVIVSIMGRHSSRKEVFYARKMNSLESFPIVLMIDEHSASASEILAGALQDHKRALVIGQRSFGKGSVQSLVRLGDQSGLKITVARYYTPKGKSIQAEGIFPDIEVPRINMSLISNAEAGKKIIREEDISKHLLYKNLSSKEKRVKGKKVKKIGMNQERNKRFRLKDKNLASDFQVVQAFNYLNVLKNQIVTN